MELKTLLTIFEVIICIGLLISILLQQKEGGLGSTFGASSGGETFRTRRGLELFLSRGTVVLIVLFAVNSLAIAYI